MKKVFDFMAIVMMASIAIYLFIWSLIAVDKFYINPDECQKAVDMFRYGE